MKKCSYCNICKAVSNFNSHPLTLDRLQSNCSGCIRDLALARKLGLDAREIIERRAKHSGRCDCCGKPETAAVGQNNPEPRALALDHDHRTGKVRGLICMNCNTVLGKVQDDEEWLIQLINYLRRSRRRP